MAFKQLFSLGELYLSDFLGPNDKPPIKSEIGLSLDKDSGLIRLSTPVSPEKMFGRYFYRSGTNQTMKDQLRDVVKDITNKIELKTGDVWLDIASNDGTLLSFVSKNIYRIGIDPAENSYVEESIKYADEIIQDFFPSPRLILNKPVKVISAIAVFYDIVNPDIFLNNINNILDDNGIFVVQMSYTPLMIKQLAFDNIVHEHLYYYSLFNLKSLFEKNGLKIVDCQLNDTNGGSFRVIAMKNIANVTKFSNAPNRDVCNFRIDSIIGQEEKLRLDEELTWQTFFNRISKLKDQVVNFITTEKRRGNEIFGLAASTKSSTLLQFMGLDNKLITAIADRNPKKWGLKTSGTNIPICSEEEFRNKNPKYALLLAWHFVDEISKRENIYLKNGGKFIVPCPRFIII